LKPRAADKPQKERHRGQILALSSGQAAKRKASETNFSIKQRTSRKRKASETNFSIKKRTKPQKKRHWKQILTSNSGQAAKGKTQVTKAEQTAKFNEVFGRYMMNIQTYFDAISVDKS
jgi:hypothetical protein